MSDHARAGRPYDSGQRRRGLRRRAETGISVYIPGEVLESAGFEPGAPPPWYRLAGYKRSRNGSTVIVSLYREP